MNTEKVEKWNGKLPIHIVNNCTIHIDRSKCKHLQNISCYNNNYYELPIKILGCNILFEHYDGGEDFTGNCIGFIENEKFVTKYYLHTNDNDEIFYIDLTTIVTQNEWT